MKINEAIVFTAWIFLTISLFYLLFTTYKLWKKTGQDLYIIVASFIMIFGNFAFLAYHMIDSYVLFISAHVLFGLGLLLIIIENVRSLLKIKKLIKIFESKIGIYRTISLIITAMLIPLILIIVFTFNNLNSTSIESIALIIGGTLFFFLSNIEGLAYLSYQRENLPYLPAKEIPSLEKTSFVSIYISLINMYANMIKNSIAPDTLQRIYNYLSFEFPQVFSSEIFNKDMSINANLFMKNLEKLNKDVREEVAGNSLKILSKKLIETFGEFTSEFNARRLFRECYIRIREVFGDNPEFKKLLNYIPEGIADEDRAKMMEKRELMEEYRRKLEKFMEVENIYSILYDMAGVGIAITDFSGLVINANNEFAKMINKKKSKIVNRNIQDLFMFAKNTDRELFQESLKKVVGGVEKETFTVHTIINGEKKIFNVISTPLRDSSNKIYAVINIFYDITQLENIRENLTRSLQEKNLLIREIHHRIKNNLQIISSLLNIYTREIKDEEAKKIIKESLNRIKTIALIHEKLYLSENFVEINFAEYVKSLVYHIYSSYHIDTNRIRPVISIEDVKLNIDKAIPCALIINELITNSIKYAFPNGMEGKIWVKMWQEGDKFIMEIGDTGIGMNGGKGEKSLGTIIVDILVKQLKGEMNMRKSKGMVYVIKFPVEG